MKGKAFVYGDVVPGPCSGDFSTTRLLQQRVDEQYMDPQTLPIKQKELYDTIKKQYKVAFEPLSIGDVRLNLLKVTDLEQILGGKDPLQDVSEFPFWIRLWEAAIVLSEFVAGHRFPDGANVLELGAGLCLVSGRQFRHEGLLGDAAARPRQLVRGADGSDQKDRESQV